MELIHIISQLVASHRLNWGITQAKLAGRETLCITGRDGLGREGRFQLFRVCDAQVELTGLVKGCFLYYHTESTYHTNTKKVIVWPKKRKRNYNLITLKYALKVEAKLCYIMLTLWRIYHIKSFPLECSAMVVLVIFLRRKILKLETGVHMLNKM